MGLQPHIRVFHRILIFVVENVYSQLTFLLYNYSIDMQIGQ